MPSSTATAARRSRSRRAFPRAVTVIVCVCVLAAMVPGRAAAATATRAETYAGAIGAGVNGHAGLYGWSAATLPGGNVLIGDYWNLRIAEYDTGGTFVPNPNTASGFFIDNPGPNRSQVPYGMAVDPRTGNVWVMDTDLWRIDIYPPSGSNDSLPNDGMLGTYGIRGTSPGQFEYAAYIAFDTNPSSPYYGYAYVTDSTTHHVTWFQPSGIKVPTTGPGAPQFFPASSAYTLHQPHGIAVDNTNGDVWVDDAGDAKVLVFAGDGTFITAFGGKSSSMPPKPGLFSGDLRGLAIDQAHRWAWVVDGDSGQVDQFDASTVAPKKAATFLGAFGSDTPGTPGGPGQFENGGRGVTVDGNGDVWVGDIGDFRAEEWTVAQNPVSGAFTYTPWLDVPNPPAPPPTGGFNGPRGAAVDAAGDLFVTDTYNERIQKFGTTAAACGTAAPPCFLTSWGLRGVTGPDQFNYPRLLAIDPTTQDLIITNTDSGAIVAYDNAGGFLWDTAQNPGGGIGHGVGQLSSPYGVAVAQDGTVYVADTGNSRIAVFTDTGQPVKTYNGGTQNWFGTRGTTAGTFAAPRGITVDPNDGSLWITDSGRDVVEHWSTAGTWLGVGGSDFGCKPSKNCSAGAMSQPFGITFDTAGTTVYVADQGGNRVDVWNYAAGSTPAGDSIAPASTYSFGGAEPMRLPQGLAFANGTLYVVEQLNDWVSEWTAP